jgi:hypothetical protein
MAAATIPLLAAGLVAGQAVASQGRASSDDASSGLPPASGIAPQRGGSPNHSASGSASYPPVATSAATPEVGSNVNVIDGNDVTQQATIGDTSVFTCNPGKPTAQNETSIAVNPADDTNLVGGANDYRLYEPSENRYDGSGGYYQSTSGGKTWSAGYLPGLVRAAPSPGIYQSAGDPAVSAGPASTFWYANLAFNRSDNANSVAVSRSTDGGSTWTTSFVIQTSAVAGARLFNDKEWVAADPHDGTGHTAYVTWTQFDTSISGASVSSPIVFSKTTDGGAHWSAPALLSSVLVKDQGSTVAVDVSGNVYVTYEATYKGHDWVAESISTTGGTSFTTKLIARIQDIASPLPNDTFRTDSFPVLAIDGTHQYVAWSNWTGTNAVVVLTTSSNNGSTWSSPLTLAGGPGNHFFPWLSARGGKVAATWYNDSTGPDTYKVEGRMSSDGAGSFWSSTATVSSENSDVINGNYFGYPNCADDFIGDYNAVALDSVGVAHALWTDIRDADSTLATNQNPYTATVS